MTVRRPGLFAFNAAASGGNLAWGLALVLNGRPWPIYMMSLLTAAVCGGVVYWEWRRVTMAKEEKTEVKPELVLLGE